MNFYRVREQFFKWILLNFLCVYMKGLFFSGFFFLIICIFLLISIITHGIDSLENYYTKLTILIFIIKGFQTIVFIFIVISTMFRPICPLAFFTCLSNSRTFIELRTTSFIESTGVACSDSVSHNQVQVLSIPVLLLACCQDWTCNLQMNVSLEVYNC